MSSTYTAVCMQHMPPLMIDDNDHHSPECALREARKDESHKACGLMIGRWSGGLVQVGCACDDRYHHDIMWVESTWLLIAALADEGDYSAAMGEALRKSPPCFNRARLRQLRPFLIQQMIAR